MVNLASKIERMEKMMVKMMEILKNGTAGGATVGGAAGVKRENDECTVSTAYTVSTVHA